MNLLRNRNVKVTILWLFPILYEWWYKLLDTFPRDMNIYEKGEGFVDCNTIISLLADIMVFFMAFHILYFFLYIIVLSMFKNAYKLITGSFLAFQIISAIFINYIYGQPQSIIELGWSMCYFIPFYFVVYIIVRDLAK